MSRILVTDDSASIRLLLKRRLERVGHEVCEARDGCEAIEAVTAGNPGKPELVLLDLMMPRVDGIDALREIKKREPSVPVLLVSALDASEAPRDWELADGHVRKPIDFDDLLARVDLLTGGPPLHGSPSP